MQGNTYSGIACYDGVYSWHLCSDLCLHCQVLSRSYPACDFVHKNLAEFQEFGIEYQIVAYLEIWWSCKGPHFKYQLAILFNDAKGDMYIMSNYAFDSLLYMLESIRKDDTVHV